MKQDKEDIWIGWMYFELYIMKQKEEDIKFSQIYFESINCSLPP